MHPVRSCARTLGTLLALAVGLSIGSTSGAARADEADVKHAREAYDRGVRAHDAGDDASAARAFAEADGLFPTPASLEGALESSMRADDPALGLELLDRAEGRPLDASLRRTVDAARKRFAGRAGRIRFECRGASRCLVAVDGAAVPSQKQAYVRIGPHAVVLQRDGQRLERLVEVSSETVVVGNEESPPKPSPVVVTPAISPVTSEHTSSSGISPTWFWVGLGATAALGAFTVASGVDAVNIHDRFEQRGCSPGASGPVSSVCSGIHDDGRGAELRTNVLLGVTGALAVATAAVGIFAVRWKSGAEARVAFSGSRGTAVAGVQIVTP